MSDRRQVKILDSLWLISSYDSAEDIDVDITQELDEKYETDVSIFICTLKTDNLDEQLLYYLLDDGINVKKWIQNQLADS